MVWIEYTRLNSIICKQNSNKISIKKTAKAYIHIATGATSDQKKKKSRTEMNSMQ